MTEFETLAKVHEELRKIAMEFNVAIVINGNTYGWKPMTERCRQDEEAPMTQYRVTTTITLEAGSPKEAAMKAFALHDTMTPEDYQAAEEKGEGSWLSTDIFLEQDDKDEARRAYRAGEYFKEVKI